MPKHDEHDVPSAGADELWRAMLTSPSPWRRIRRLHRRIPSPPRCKLCAAPFAGVGGLVMPALGHGRWPKNPKYCRGCFSMLQRSHGGAEVECSLLFADVRDSTARAERLSPRDFNRLMGRFYDAAVGILVDHDAFVDKFVGDEIIGIFVPAMAGDRHAARTIEAARRLLLATGHGSGRPWVPVGAGVGSGIAYVGSIGGGADTELTAMGDLVNTTARLASAAGPGEILVTAAAADRASLILTDHERRSLALKGKSQPTDVVVLGTEDTS